MPDSGSAVESPLDRLRRLARESKAAKADAPAPAVGEPVIPAVPDPVTAVSSAEEPVFEEPAFEEPTFGEPAFGEPTFGEPVFEEPSVADPALEDPVFAEPALEEPAAAEGEPEALPEPPIEVVEQVGEEPLARPAESGGEPTLERPGPPAPARLRATGADTGADTDTGLGSERDSDLLGATAGAGRRDTGGKGDSSPTPSPGHPAR